MTIEIPDHLQYLGFAERLADQSRAILLEAAKHAPKIEIKPDDSFVTETDKAVEARLREMITSAFPSHGILGEEFEDVGIDSEYVWVLDPIDGTAAFVAGIPVYGTLIALAWNGAPYVGVVDHPVTAERLAGVVGKFATHNGAQIQSRQCNTLSQAYVTCSNPDFMSANEQERLARVREQVAYVQYGGSCYSYGTLASGRTDLAIDSGLEAFDLYATAAVIQGAGGFMCDWQGNDISLDIKGKVMAGGDTARRDDLIELLN